MTYLELHCHFHPELILPPNHCQCQMGLCLSQGSLPKFDLEDRISLTIFLTATMTFLAHRSSVILTNVRYLWSYSVISFLDCQLFLISFRFQTTVFPCACILNTCLCFSKAWRLRLGVWNRRVNLVGDYVSYVSYCSLACTLYESINK